MKQFDLIIIGSGPGGYTTAALAASLGANVAVVERDILGGTCLNRGCIPTKCLAATAEAMLSASRFAALGVDVAGVTLDYPRAAARKDSVVASLREAVEGVLSGVTVIKGEARFTDAHTLEVGSETLTAPKIIVATGSRPATLPIPGAELAVDSDFMLAATELPSSAVIIGGGVIGLEFASILNACGCGVTVLEYAPEILPGFDADLSKRLRMSLKRRGVSIQTSAAVTAIADSGAGRTVSYTFKGKEKTAEAQSVIMAVGRRPVLPPGLMELNPETERGFLKVDKLTMQTSIPGVYAVGDVNGLCMLAHAAEAQGRVALGLASKLSTVPAAVFTVPECASVGMTEQQCAELQMDYKTGSAIYRSSGKALAMDEPDGMVKVIVGQRGKLLGCHICGAHASDLIQEMSVAIANGLTATDIVTTIHPHPTLSELLVSALHNALKG